MGRTLLYLGLFALSVSTGCSRREKPLDELNIEAVEVGDVPASTVPNLPAEQDVVVFNHGPGPTSTAYYRHTVACPSRMINSMSGIRVLKDRIQLCFEPVEATSPEARPLSACPYDLAVKYEMFGIPQDVNPRFEVVGACSNLTR